MLPTAVLRNNILRPVLCRILPFRGVHTPVAKPQDGYRVVVVGGGTGGCASAARLCRKLGKGKVALVEPSEAHYYQPLFTLVGGGIRSLSDAVRPMSEVLPPDADWVKDSVTSFDPENNMMVTQGGHKIHYDYLVISVGIKPDFKGIKGLEEGLNEDPMVVTNYSPLYVNKTFKAMQLFKEGNAIFSHPETYINCAGAPQKIMYLTEEYLRMHGKREGANLMYNAAVDKIFKAKKYADSLWKVCESRDMKVNLKHNLVEIKPKEKKAVFENLDTKERKTYEYEMIHVSPPMTTPESLRQSTLADKTGLLTINPLTLQHTKYPNIFGLGDCTDLPTSKTAAAVASQNIVLYKSVMDVYNGKEPSGKYNGYTSCPLVTSRSTCIMAEFDYDLQPMETFPIDQSVERRTMYYMKKSIIPEIYWKVMLKGRWSGPGMARKILHFGLK